MKIMLLDVETTGLDSSRHSLWSIAAQFHCNGKQTDFHVKCRPLDGAEIDEKALEVAQVTRADLEGYIDAFAAQRRLEGTLRRLCDKFNKADKFQIIAYNARFDYDFLRAWWDKLAGKKSYFGSYFWFPPLDVMNLAAMHLMRQRAELANFKQGTVAQALGIEVEENRLHDASYDLRLMAQIFKKLYRMEAGK